MKKLIVILCALYGLTLQAQDIIPLAGFWDFSVGESASFNDKDSSYVMLPGSMLTNGKGDLVSVNTQWTGSLYDSSYFFNPYMQQYRVERKFPFFLTPERHYVGKAWYHKKVYVPKEWKGRRMTLFLERPHIETTVWVNGKEVGHQMSLSTPHRYDVTSKINVGEPNDITICVYNGIENVCVGQDSHSVTDQTQGNWNGIAGRIELQAQWKKLNIRHVRIIPSSDMQTFKVVVELENHVPGLRMLPLNDYFVAVTVREISPDGTPQPRTLRQAKKNVEGLDKVEFEFSVFGLVSHRPSKGDLRLWDEFNPQLYQLTVEGGEDVFEMNFGLRNVSIKGRQLCINRPYGYRIQIESLILHILFQLLSHFSIQLHRDDLPEPSKDQRRIKEIVSYIAENYAKPISLDEISDRFGLSNEYFSRFTAERARSWSMGPPTYIASAPISDR